MYVPEDHLSIEAIHVRTVDKHYNVKMLLEKNPCDNCLWISKFVNNGDGTISVDISIRHPYPANRYFTGFDVRGIFYSPAHYFIENPYQPHDTNAWYFPALEKGDPELLNPDGYTRAFSPFKYNPDKPPITRYQPGGKLGGTFDIDDKEEEFGEPHWPFIYFYSSEVRRHFDTMATDTRTYHIALPPGQWEFGYSVDAVWAPPTKVPVMDIETDFPWEANTLEVYDIDVSISGPLIGLEPSTVTMRFYNHFPELLQFYYIANVYAQCITGMWADVKDPIIVGDEYVEFSWELVNELGRPPGDYPMIIWSELGTPGGEYLTNEKGITEKWWKNAIVMDVFWVTVES
jgi:hypothetical protein